MDEHHVDDQRERAACGACLGAGAGTGNVSDDVPGGHGSGFDPVGHDCGAFLDAGRADDRGVRVADHVSVCATFSDSARARFPTTRRTSRSGLLPQLALDTEPDDGPVRISVEYRVPPENYAEFTHAIHKLRGVRLRDGAMRWGIYRDAVDPEHLNETFIMESWLDYLRSRERITAADEAIRAQVRALHQDDDPPKTTYQIYAREVANPVPSHSAATPLKRRRKTGSKSFLSFLQLFAVASKMPGGVTRSPDRKSLRIMAWRVVRFWRGPGRLWPSACCLVGLAPI